MVEKFNVRPHELENYDTEWIHKMMCVSQGEFTAEKNQTDNIPKGNQSVITNPITKTYKGKKK